MRLASADVKLVCIFLSLRSDCISVMPVLGIRGRSCSLPAQTLCHGSAWLDSPQQHMHKCKCFAQVNAMHVSDLPDVDSRSVVLAGEQKLWRSVPSCYHILCHEISL